MSLSTFLARQSWFSPLGVIEWALLTIRSIKGTGFITAPFVRCRNNVLLVKQEDSRVRGAYERFGVSCTCTCP